jgi:hypothetical protein
VISLIATALMTDYTGKDIEGEYSRRRPASAISSR